MNENKTDSIKQKWNDFSKIIIIIHFYSDKLTCIIIYVEFSFLFEAIKSCSCKHFFMCATYPGKLSQQLFQTTILNVTTETADQVWSGREHLLIPQTSQSK